MKNIVLTLCTVTISAASAFAQADGGASPDVQRRLEMIERGQTEAVRAELPTLMTTFQNHPGVLYLQAILTTDGTEASKVYQSIVDNFPKSEWADDALFKLYQYYYSVGLYKTGDQKLLQLRQEYPFSTYAVTAQQDEPAKSKPEEPPAQIASPNPIQKYPTSFTVQVGAFSTLQNAEELRARFERENYSSNIFTIVNNGRKLHKVWVGEFQTYEDAKRFTGEIRNKFNLASIVVSR
jgi:hypothetical protein